MGMSSDEVLQENNELTAVSNPETPEEVKRLILEKWFAEEFIKGHAAYQTWLQHFRIEGSDSSCINMRRYEFFLTAALGCFLADVAQHEGAAASNMIKENILNQLGSMGVEEILLRGMPAQEELPPIPAPPEEWRKKRLDN